MERIFAEDIKSFFQPANNFTNLGSLTNVIVRNAFTIAGLIFLVLLIFGGFQFIVAAGSGDSKKLEQGKKALSGAVIGLVLIIGSVWIIQIIEMLTGLAILPK